MVRHIKTILQQMLLKRCLFILERYTLKGSAFVLKLVCCNLRWNFKKQCYQFKNGIFQSRFEIVKLLFTESLGRF